MHQYQMGPVRTEIQGRRRRCIHETGQTLRRSLVSFLSRRGKGDAEREHNEDDESTQRAHAVQYAVHGYPVAFG